MNCMELQALIAARPAPRHFEKDAQIMQMGRALSPALSRLFRMLFGGWAAYSGAQAIGNVGSAVGDLSRGDLKGTGANLLRAGANASFVLPYMRPGIKIMRGLGSFPAVSRGVQRLPPRMQTLKPVERFARRYDAWGRLHPVQGTALGLGAPIGAYMGANALDGGETMNYGPPPPWMLADQAGRTTDPSGLVRWGVQNS